jgi:hypothetical protein
MEISANTVSVLQNFAAINSNIVIKPGNKIMTISEAKNILSEASVQEEFNNTVGIYDLQEFLNVLKLVDSPSLKFEENYMRIGGNGGRAMVTYYYSDPEILTTPTKPIVMPEEDVWFTLDEGTANSLKKAAAVFGHSQLLIEADKGSIKLTVSDPDNSTANQYSVAVDGGYKEENFKFILNIANLKMVSGSYNVKISKKLISQFTNEDSSLTYWIALEKSSTYGA